MTFQQPTAQAPMGTASVERKKGDTSALPAGEQHTGTWRHSAFKCEDTNLCCYTHLCCCMAYSNERSRLKHLEMHEKAPDRQVGVDAILYAAGMWFCLYWPMQMMTRARVRQRYNMPQKPFTDFCMTLCCPCPALMQEIEQIKDEEEGLIQGQGAGELRVI